MIINLIYVVLLYIMGLNKDLHYLYEIFYQHWIGLLMKLNFVMSLDIWQRLIAFVFYNLKDTSKSSLKM